MLELSGFIQMSRHARLGVAAMLAATLAAMALGQNAGPNAAGSKPEDPVPDARTLMLDVVEHQKQLEKVRENYTYHSMITDQELDSNGQTKKTETEDRDVFFVNSHRIERTVKKDGKPLNDHDKQKEDERIAKLVDKAQKTPREESLDGQGSISITKILDIMDVNNPRRETYRGRATIVFDFAGKHDAKTHGIAEDASKKLAGTLWVDEKDRQVAHMEARFIDNFHLGGGLVANVQKGSSFTFDQAPVNGEIWFPTYAEGRVDARVMIFKGMREHFVEQDSNYERFTVNAETSKSATVVEEPKK